MRAIFRMCGSDSQLGLQLVEKLATLHGINSKDYYLNGV